MTPTAFASWQQQLDRACAQCVLVRRAVVLAETTSTQDAVETADAPSGTVITTWRQTSGRGRFGRQWIDTATSGVAATFVVDPQPLERLALVSAIAAAEACEATLGRRVGIKWPNDIMVDGRKLAGVLIEQRGARVLIGIGINVAHSRFEEDLESRATSMAMLGIAADRLHVICALISAIDRALVASDDALIEAFFPRDALRGTRALFSTPDGPIEGEVRSIDPLRGLMVRTESGDRFLPARSTSVAEWGGIRRR